MLCQRARSPPRSRPRRCAISSSTDVLVEARPLRRFFCITSGRLFEPVRGCRRSLAVSDTIDPPLSVCSETKLSPSFLRTTPARKPRTECCCQSVAVMSVAIVAPAGVRSIAMMRACLVLGRAADRNDAGAVRLRDAALAIFRAVERVVAFGLVLGLVMGSSEVHAALSAAPPQPRLGKSPGRAGP